MILYAASLLFTLVFVVIAPPSRRFLAAHLEDMNSWAPFSYIVLAGVAIAPIAVMVVINRLPKVVEPEDPMAKYRHAEPPSED